MATSKEMTEGRTLPQIFYFTLPLLLGNMLQQTYSLVDAAIVGKFLGINALASVGASTSVVFLILGFCNGCCGGFGIPVAQKFGARDYATMRRYVAVSLQLAGIMSVVLTALTCLLCGDILRWMRTPDNIYEGAYWYLLITFIGIPCTFFYNLLSSIIRALGDSKTPFWFLLFSTVLNIVLDLFCILVLDWGVAGAAIATVVSQGVSAALCYRYMMRHFDILRATPSERKFNGALARTLLYIGMPMGLQFSITAIGSIMLQSANNALGTACVAAFTAGMRIKMLFICTFESLGIAMATFAGQNYGAGKPERIWQGVKSSALMMMIYWVFTFVVLMLDLLGVYVRGADAGGAHHRSTLRRAGRGGDTQRHGALPACVRMLLPCLGTALHPALHHPGSGIHGAGHALRRVGDDSPHLSQRIGGAGMGLHRRLLWRPYGMDIRRRLPDTRLYLRLQTD